MTEEKSLLIKVLGDSLFIRVVDFLIENRIFDYTKTDIAENSGISRTALYQIWPILEGYGIVKESRKIGNTTLYRLNKENQIVQKLIELDLKISKEFVGSLVEKQIAVVKHKKRKTK